MDVKSKKEAETKQNAKNLIKELKTEDKKKEEHAVKKTAAQKKRDKKKKKKIVKIPEPIESKSDSPSPPSPISPVPLVFRTEKPPKPPKFKPPTKLPEKLPPLQEPASSLQDNNDNEEWEYFNKRQNNKSETAIKTFKHKIPSRLVGRVIGKSGASIKELRDKTQTQIDVDTSLKSVNEDCEVTIRGCQRDVRTVIDFMDVVRNNPDRSNASILEEIESKPFTELPAHSIVNNFKNRQNYTTKYETQKYEMQKYETAKYDSNKYEFQKCEYKKEPSKYENQFKDYQIKEYYPPTIATQENESVNDPKRFPPLRQTVKIEELPKIIPPIKSLDSKPKISNIPPPTIPASNVKWSVEPEIPIRNITSNSELSSVRGSVTLPPTTITQSRSVNLCPGAGRPQQKPLDIKEINCPIWNLLHDPALNVGFQFDEDLWKTTSAQTQPFSQKIMDEINNFKLDLGKPVNQNPNTPISNIPSMSQSNISTRTWFDSTTPSM